ncbi:universal stress protein [Sphingomonas sp. UNC305MFCol5.2]|uniref:universal stress protein n=1 Tax=Sphingomonas sp. UNC305MFCol5.2 TaxID=1449076 RepID=UPI000B04A034|nr:universal stress protein [Sphingomonas sp. UNC305MFCol5.2]
MADEQVREQGNRAQMEARLKTEGVSYDWADETGFLSPTVCDSVGLADVIVLNRELDTIAYPDMRDLVGDAVLRTGKPIVAVPEAGRGFDVFGPALIAWDGSPEAVAALQAATPLLAKARSVAILEVDDGSIRLPAEHAAGYLSRHDIKPMIRRENSLIDLPSTVILDTIGATGATWLVMGGFGHSRFVEACFGGVSRRVLKECPVPLFLAH